MEWNDPSQPNDPPSDRMGLVEFQRIAKLWPSFAAMARDVGVSRAAIHHFWTGYRTPGRKTTRLLRLYQEKYERLKAERDNG